MATFVYSGVTYTAPAVGTTEFALTSDSGNAIGYLSQDHIKVYKSTDAGVTWSQLTVTTDYTFNSQGTSIVLTAGTTAGDQIRLQRKTPLSAQWVTFSDGSVLTSNQLNQAELFSLYCDQELEDGKAGVDGTVPGEAVKSVTGTAPILVDNTDNQTPVIDIDETDSTGDSNALTSDTRVMSEKAIDDAFRQYIGTSPTTGEKVGQLRIDDTGAIPLIFYWDGSAWIQTPTKGEQGATGPAGPPPGLQDPAASAATVPLEGDGSLGTATAQVLQDPTSKDLKFLFGIPAGQTGAKGDKGDDSTVPGPPPGLQSPPATASNVANNPDGSIGQATATVSADGNKDLQFTFGIPVGAPGPIGPPGEGVDYKGPIDSTTAAEPSPKANGDFYVNTTAGTSTWPGLGTVTQNDRLIYNGNTNQWDRYTPPPISGVDLSWGLASNQGTVQNAAGTDAIVPLADLTYAGLMAPGDKSKLNGIEAGAEVNPNLDNYLEKGDNVSELVNDAGYVTSASIPAPTLQNVLEAGNTSDEDLWIGENGEYAKLLANGYVEASYGLKVNTTKNLARDGVILDGDFSMNAGGYAMRFYSSSQTLGEGDGYTLIQRDSLSTQFREAGGWGKRYFFSARQDLITISNDNSNGAPTAITGGTAVVHVYNGLNTQFGTNSSQLGNVAPLNDWTCYPART